MTARAERRKMISVGERRSRRCEREAAIMGSVGRSLASPLLSNPEKTVFRNEGKTMEWKAQKRTGELRLVPLSELMRRRNWKQRQGSWDLEEIKYWIQWPEWLSRTMLCEMTRELDPLPLSWGCYCSCSYFCLTRPRHRIARSLGSLSLTHTHIDKYIQFR